MTGETMFKLPGAFLLPSEMMGKTQYFICPALILISWAYNTNNYITYECKQYVSGYVVIVFYTVRV